MFVFKPTQNGRQVTENEPSYVTEKSKKIKPECDDFQALKLR